MLPGSIANNLANVASGGIKKVGNFALRYSISMQPPNFNYVIGCKSSLVVVHPLAPRLATLAISILHILVLCSKRQMGRIAAGSIIATMKNARAMIALSIWYRAIGQLISDAVGRKNLPIYAKTAISLSSICGFPFPALILAAPIYFVPKAFLQWRRVHLPMIFEVFYGFAFDQTVPCGVLGREFCFLPTATMTVAVGNFFACVVARGCEKWELWSSIHDVVSSFQLIGLIRGRSRGVARCFCCLHSFNYNTSGAI